MVAQGETLVVLIGGAGLEALRIFSLASLVVVLYVTQMLPRQGDLQYRVNLSFEEAILVQKKYTIIVKRQVGVLFRIWCKTWNKPCNLWSLCIGQGLSMLCISMV